MSAVPARTEEAGDLPFLLLASVLTFVLVALAIPPRDASRCLPPLRRLARTLRRRRIARARIRPIRRRFTLTSNQTDGRAPEWTRSAT